MTIPSAVFKVECLNLIDEVARTGRPVVITRRGRPVAQLAPLPAAPRSLFGYMNNTVTITGDVVAATGERWNAGSDEGDHLRVVVTGKQCTRRAVSRK
jgi:prevent-host-death family protein